MPFVHSAEAMDVLNSVDIIIADWAVKTVIHDCSFCRRDYPYYGTFCQACAFKAAEFVLDYSSSEEFYQEFISG